MDDFVDLTNDDTTDATDAHITISDDEDEELKLAIALSLQDQTASPKVLEPNPALGDQRDETPKPTTLSSMSLLGLDRKVMEAERLARLKRKREEVNDMQPSSTPLAASRISPPPLQRRKLDVSKIPQSKPKASTSNHRPPSRPNFSFPHGKVLFTSTPTRHSTTGTLEAISFIDVLKPPSDTLNYTLKSTLLSSFITDFDWALPYFSTATVKFVLVLHAQNSSHKQNLQQDFAGIKNVRLVTPEVSGGFGTMHSKVILLFFEAKEDETKQICRVVVPSANLVPFDWGVGGVMENVLYVVDLPLKQQTLSTNQGQGQETQFETELKKQLLAMNVPEDVLRKLDNYDFLATKDIGFVHTISGPHVFESHSSAKITKQQTISAFPKTNLQVPTVATPQLPPPMPNDLAQTGLLSLSKTISSLGLSIPTASPSYPPSLHYITSSLGNLTPSFIRQLYSAVCGTLDPNTSTATATPSSRRSKTPTTANNESNTLDNTIRQNLHIYFPSTHTVHTSKGGPSSAGTICFQRKWWEENDLIRECLRDCVGGRGDGMLMHSKILYVRFNEPLAVKGDAGGTKMYAGWVYVGSANLSESAWGRIVSDAKSKKPKITSRNWESGVVIPVSMDNVAILKDAEGHVLKEAGHHGCGSIDTSVDTSTGTATAVREQGRRGDGQRSDRGVSASNCTRKVLGCRHNADGGSCMKCSEHHLGESSCSDAARHDAGDLQQDACTMQSDINRMRELSLSEIFSNTVPVPIRLPSSTQFADAREPWFLKD